MNDRISKSTKDDTFESYSIKMNRLSKNIILNELKDLIRARMQLLAN